jgi:aldose 1-epimerase
MKKIMQFVMLSSAGLGAACFVGCAGMPIPTNTVGTISQAPFGKTADGTPVEIYTLRNSKRMEARIMTYGGIIVSLKVPDKNGNFGDVVLGFDSLDGYVNDAYIKGCPYFGALIGRYGNRIAKGKFAIGGQEYTLGINNAPNNLHGGPVGFDKRVWKATTFLTPDGPVLQLTYLSKDGEEGFPGNLSVTATYTLTEDNGLLLNYTATTDKATLCNLTQHSYFNLAGKGDILNHLVCINADKFTPVDKTLIPNGELKPVQGTPFDFRIPTTVGTRINADDEQIKFGNGYDHNWVVNKPLGKLGLVARVTDPSTGRVMEVLSTEPGVQFYTGNFLDGSLTGKGGWVYQQRNGLCFEPQHYPDSPNHPQFPSAELKPGQTYQNTIIYRFSVQP